MLNYRIYKIFFRCTFLKWKLEGGLENISQYAELRLGLGVAFNLSLYISWFRLFKKIFLLRFRKNVLKFKNHSQKVSVKLK